MRLIDRDALIKRLSMLKKRIALPAAGFVDEDSYECGAVDALCDAIRYAEEAPAVVMDINDPDNWISVKDRMPEDGRFVLVVNDDGKMMIAKYESEAVRWEYKYINYDWDVWDDEEQGPICYWMPLPNLPKGERA